MRQNRYQAKDNRQRAVLIGRIIQKQYRELTLEYGIAYALADLRHLCDRWDFDFAQLDQIGYRHYSLEISEAKEIVQ